MTTDHAPDHPPVAAPLGDVTTERLTLRRFRAADAEALAPVFAEPAVWRYPYGRGLTAEETATFVEKRVAGWDAQGFDLWVAEERATGRVIGFVGLSVPRFLPEVLPAVEVGWRLHPDVWGRGYATEGRRRPSTRRSPRWGWTRSCRSSSRSTPRRCGWPSGSAWRSCAR